MKKIVSLSVAVLLACTLLAQNVGIGTSTPNTSAQLDVSSTTKGMLIPRMTEAEKNTIVSPAQGLMIFNTTSNSFQFFNGSIWSNITHSGIVTGAPNRVAKFNSPWGLTPGMLTDNGVGVSLNNTATVANASAILDITSNNKGLLIPRMLSTERTAIASPATGLLVFDNTTNSFWFYNGAVWVELTSGSLSGSGTSNFIPKFTGSNSIGNSSLEDKADSLVLTTKVAFEKSNGSLYFRDSSASIHFPVPGNNSPAMVYMFPSGLQNKDRMVVSLSPSFPNWGLEFRDSTDAFHFRSNSGRKFSFELGSGNLGIGVEDPSFTLDINGEQRFTQTAPFSYPNNGIWFANQSNTFNRAFFGMAKPDSTIGIYSQHLGDWAIEFEVMREPRIGIGNRKTIGTTTGGVPRAELHVVHTNFGGSNDGVRIQNEGSNEHYWNLYTSNTTGNFEFFKQGIKRATIDGTSGAYTAVSDDRLKRNIKFMPDGTLSKVMELKPSTYQFSKMTADEGGVIESNRYYNGFLAQEVEKIFPELVYKGTDNPNQDFYTMDYSGFGVIAIKAIQEQQKLIDELKKEKEELGKMMLLLRTEMDELKKIIVTDKIH